jgi:hypothetical protein
MARRPDVSKQVLTRQELEQLNHRLAAMSLRAVRDFYHSAYLSCRLDMNRVPSARNIQELVQAWKQIRSWSKHK